jgi:hypothetical protein
MGHMACFEIDCDSCGRAYRDSFNQLIKKQEGQALVNRLMNDDLFKSVCPHCQHVHYIDLPLMYADEDKKAIVFYCSDQLESAQAKPYIERRMEEFGFNNSNGFIRMASSQNELREKVILLENDLDDRIVEILKLWALESLRKEGHDEQFAEVRCGVLKDGTLSIDFIGEQPRHITIPRSYYDKMVKTLSPHLTCEETPFEVSVEYAVQFATAHNC